MHRVIIFANGASWVSSRLFKATLKSIRSRDDMKLVALCLSKPPKYTLNLFRSARSLAVHTLRSAFNRGGRHNYKLLLPTNFEYWAQRDNFKILLPPDNHTNHPAFIHRLRSDLRPTAALSYFYMQKFSPELLRVFQHAVNYHNGLLPDYRGLKATAWSVYNGEQTTGYTFHRMTPGLDEGPVLLQAAPKQHCCSDSNGVKVHATRFHHLPFLLYRALQWTGKKTQSRIL